VRQGLGVADELPDGFKRFLVDHVSLRCHGSLGWRDGGS
jgi:hypothetical protein